MRKPSTLLLCLLLLFIGTQAPATLWAVDFQTEFALLHDLEYHIRIGIDDCDSERSVARVVPDSNFELLDSAGKVLYLGIGNTPLRFTRHDAQPAAINYYYIIETFDTSDHAKADAFAKTASAQLKRKVTIRSDPRQVASPSPTPSLPPFVPRLAALVGPYSSRSTATVDDARIRKSYKPIFHIAREAKTPGRIEARDAKGKLLAQAMGYIAVRSTKPTNSLIRARKLRSTYQDWSKPGAWLTSDNRAYRDMIEIWINPKAQLSIVNRVFLEHYVYGVVQPEIGLDSPFEVKKVQAVIARSEAIAKLISDHRHDADPYDHCDNTHCQVYMGALKEKPEINAAVDATQGEVCAYDNKIADTVYSHSCGGVTANCEDVWEGDRLPYQRSVYDGPDPKDLPDLSTSEGVEKFMTSRPMVYCNPAQKGFPSHSRDSHFRWQRTYTAAQLAARFKRRPSTYGPIDKVTNLSVTKRTPSGRVLEIQVTTNAQKHPFSIRGEMPILVAFYQSGDILDSTFFSINRQYDATGNLQRLTIKGAGWGHGIGLCQVGATVMAAQGHSYIDILQHYYKGIDIYKIYE